MAHPLSPAARAGNGKALGTIGQVVARYDGLARAEGDAVLEFTARSPRSGAT